MKKNWTQAELDCIKEARKANIRLKIIAGVLGRSMLSVHKRLVRLKSLSSKGKSVEPLNQKKTILTPQDALHKMKGILKRYHLKGENHEMMKILSTGIWTKDPLPKNLHTFKKAPQGSLKKTYIHIDSEGVTKLLYEKLRDIDERVYKRKDYQNFLSVPLTLIEYWAKKEKVAFVKWPTIHYDYVLSGQCLTQAQFILYVNKCRVGQSLLPFQVTKIGEERV